MNNNNTILIVCNRVPYPLKDGGALAMFAMIKGWHSLGKQVHLLAMNTSKHSVDKEDLPKLFTEIASFEMVKTNTEIKVLPTLINLIFSKKPQHAQRFYKQHFERKIIEKINQVEPCIIQLESIYLQEYAEAIRKHSKALLMQRLHNIEAEIWQRLAQETNSLFKKFYLSNLAKRIEKYEHFVWGNCDALIPISNNDEYVIVQSGCGTALCTTAFGIDVQPKIFQLKRSDIAYHVGAMDWQPNLDAMMWMRNEIVPEILKKIPSFQFQFAGRKMPNELIFESTPSFECKGEVADLLTFTADKGILLVPLRSGSGIRIKTIEAMAQGKLVISTSVGIQGIEAKDKTHFLLANTPVEFATALEWCSTNKNKVDQIIANAQQLIIDKHSQQALMNQLDVFVEKLFQDKNKS